MRFRTLFDSLLAHSSGRNSRQRRIAPRSNRSTLSFRPLLDLLEDRCLLTAPQILLTPSVLANLRQEAANNSPVWQAFKANLDNKLSVLIADDTGSYEGSQLAFIEDYALGYQVLMNSDPLTADNYADKAIGLMKSGLDDFQRGSWVARQFLVRGNGTTRTFTLPNANLDPSTLTVYLSDVDTESIVHQIASGQDSVGSENLIFLKVSNAPDGTANYAKGTDWKHNPNFPNDEIDWSTAANQPAVGATYFLTYTSGENADATTAFTLNGNTITFTTAPAKNQAVFVQYIYGTHSADGSTLAFQQTSAGDGGFNNVFVDSSYSYRYLGTGEAMGLDWLDGYVGMTPAFEKQVETMLVRWSHYVQSPITNAFLPNSGASNYGDTDYESEVFTALALAPRDTIDGPALVTAALAWRQNNLLPVLEKPTTSDFGGYWAEGWNYGTEAVQALLVAGDALQTAGLITATAEAQFSNQVMDSVVEEESSPGLTYDGGEDYEYPFHFVDKSLFYVLSQTCASPTEQSYANFVIQNYPDSAFGEATAADYEQMLFDNPSAPASFWSDLPLADFASGTGLVVARSDWGTDPTFMATQMGNYLDAGHQFPIQMEVNRGADQLLVNAYQIYYVFGNGSLTPNTDSFLGNLVVVNAPTDPDPPNMGAYFGTPGVVDTAYENTAAYTYFDANYAASYSPEDAPGSGGQVSQLTRQVVFVRPGLMFVYDRAATTSASDSKTLQWNFASAPTVNGNGFTETVGSSTLFGQIYSTVPISTSLSALNDPSLGMTSDAPTIEQLETENITPSAGVNYLTAFQVAPSTTPTMDPSEHILSNNNVMEGTEIDNQLVLFGRSGPVAPGATVAYTFNGQAAVQHLLVDLKPSQVYEVSYNGTAEIISSSDQGTLTFSTPAGVGSVKVQLCKFSMSGFAAAITAGNTATFTVTALNADGSTNTSYTGTVHFTSSDPQAQLPADYTFTKADKGQHTFSVTFKTAGTRSITVQDKATGIGGIQPIVVQPAAAVSFVIAAFPSPTTAGTSGSFTVTAFDAFGNRATGYAGTVHFTSSDTQAVLPGNYTFTAADRGKHTFHATLKTAGTQSLTATDTTTATLTGSQSPIQVNPAAASHFVVTAPSSVTAGVAFQFTVTAEDRFGNVAAGYTGTVHFTSSDPKAVLPADYAFLAGDNGVHTFSATLNTTGARTLRATDTTNKSLTGADTNIIVSNPPENAPLATPTPALATDPDIGQDTVITGGTSYDNNKVGQLPVGVRRNSGSPGHVRGQGLRLKS
jgi:hypothetical protein